jgi:GAF domain-containing protein
MDESSAEAIIAEQARQIRRLEDELERRRGGRALEELLRLSDVTAAIVGEAPYRSLLNGIIEAAKRIFDAGAASLSLLDHETNELVFVAAAEPELIGMRFPAHRGIAGWVVMTGEPIAVGDVRRDPRWAGDFAASTGYVPKSIMAVPLIVGEEVEGVLSVLDKASAASFGLDDLELLGLFARPAAIAVEQSRLVGSVGRMLLEELRRLAAGRGEDDLARTLEAVSAEAGAAGDRVLVLARLVHTLSRRGDRSTELAIEVLAAIARHTSR